MKRGNKMSKKVLTKEFIKKHIRKGAIAASIVLLVLVTIAMLCMTNGDVNYGVAFILLLFSAVLLVAIVSSIKKINMVNRGDYTIDTDILVDTERKVSRSSKRKDVDYYLYFQNHDKRVKTNRKVYNESDIGDEFYLVKVDGAVYPFNSYEYELDESIKYNLY